MMLLKAGRSMAGRGATAMAKLCSQNGRKRAVQEQKRRFTDAPVTTTGTMTTGTDYLQAFGGLSILLGSNVFAIWALQREGGSVSHDLRMMDLTEEEEEEKKEMAQKKKKKKKPNRKIKTSLQFRLTTR